MPKDNLHDCRKTDDCIERVLTGRTLSEAVFDCSSELREDFDLPSSCPLEQLGALSPSVRLVPLTPAGPWPVEPDVRAGLCRVRLDDHAT